MDTGSFPRTNVPRSHRMQFFPCLFVWLLFANRSHFICQMRLWMDEMHTLWLKYAVWRQLYHWMLISLQQIHNANVFLFFSNAVLFIVAMHGMFNYYVITICYSFYLWSVDIKYSMRGQVSDTFVAPFLMSRINTERNASLRYY